MEYLDGRTVRSLLDAEGPLTAPRAVRVIHDVCRGLEAAHARGVIHRDLKPENLMLVRRDDGLETCKVLDFGLAKIPVVTSSDAATQEGLPLGTLHYMSPEQARGDADIDQCADVYGCAAVLYELLTGKRPHSADSHHALLYKIVHETPQRVDELCPFIPSGLADAVRSALQNDRRLRPASMDAFRGAIEPFLANHAGPLGPPPLETLPNGRDTPPTRSPHFHLGPRPSGRLLRALLLMASGAFAGCLLTLAVVGLRTSGWLNARGHALSMPQPESNSVARDQPLAELRPSADSSSVPSVMPASTRSDMAPRPSSSSPRGSSLPRPRPSAKSIEPSTENLFERQNPYE
jgi:serine/threonine-protein kinase